MLCEAYASTLLAYNEVPAPINTQMVTVWPIDTDGEATRLNRMPPHDKPNDGSVSTIQNRTCVDAVSRYGLLTAEVAIRDARKNRARIDGLGSFLLAWSPSAKKGMPDALVLVSDLSEVTTMEQAKGIFVQWSVDIEKNPELWKKGWNVDSLKTVIKLWADKYGERLLQLVNSK